MNCAFEENVRRGAWDAETATHVITCTACQETVAIVDAMQHELAQSLPAMKPYALFVWQIAERERQQREQHLQLGATAATLALSAGAMLAIGPALIIHSVSAVAVMTLAAWILTREPC
jgi:anti-sigma factor RsiW